MGFFIPKNPQRTPAKYHGSTRTLGVHPSLPLDCKFLNPSDFQVGKKNNETLPELSCSVSVEVSVFPLKTQRNKIPKHEAIQSNCYSLNSCYVMHPFELFQIFLSRGQQISEKKHQVAYRPNSEEIKTVIKMPQKHKTPRKKKQQQTHLGGVDSPRNQKKNWSYILPLFWLELHPATYKVPNGRPLS